MIQPSGLLPKSNDSLISANPHDWGGQLIVGQEVVVDWNNIWLSGPCSRYAAGSGPEFLCLLAGNLFFFVSAHLQPLVALQAQSPAGMTLGVSYRQLLACLALPARLQQPAGLGCLRGGHFGKQ